MKYYVIDCSRLSDKDAAHNYIKARLGFPDYYGKNLDAFADCLSELGMSSRLILVAPELAGEYGERMLAVLDELADEGFIGVEFH